MPKTIKINAKSTLSTLPLPALNASAELTLLLDCLKVFLGTSPSHQLQTSRLPSINWPQFESLVAAHRLQPVIYKVLNQSSLFEALSPPVAESWRAKQQAMTKRNLHLSSTTLKLLKQLEASGIRAIPLKGPLLGRQLYNNLALREPGDIDLLIEPSATEKALSLMKELGYRWSEGEQWTPSQQELFIWRHGEISCFSTQEAIAVDFHFRWTSNEYLFNLDFEHAWESATHLNINSTNAVRVLNPVHQMLFLSMHGAKHQWYRLSWLLDIAMLLTQPQLLDWETLKQEMQTLQMQRPVVQAIALCHHFWGIETHTCQSTWSLSKGDRASTHWVSAIASQEIIKNTSISSTAVLLNNRPLLALQYMYCKFRYSMEIKKGFLYKLACTYWFLFSTKDFQTLKLPNSLSFLYILLRPFLYCWRLMTVPESMEKSANP